MPYVDVFLAPVEISKKAEYIAHSETTWEVFRDLGCVSQWECWGDDVPEGEVTSLPMAVKLKEGETVVAGWCVWPDKATRDAAWARIMSPEYGDKMGDMPFDGKRMTFGGFDAIMTREAAPASEPA
ncbi:MAG: DUF1428 domain-containing protein [Pseudomonadota bacterium]